MMPATMPTLETARLRLRPFTLQDAPRVQILAGDARVADTTLAVPHPYPDGAAEAWIGMHAQFAREGTNFVFAICLVKTGDLVGAINIMPKLAGDSKLAEIGYWLGVPFWNQGLMSEAVKAVIDWGFNTLQLQRIYARAFSRNPASARVMQKAGMQFEGVARGLMLKAGIYEDVVTHAILSSDIEQQRISMPTLETERLTLRAFQLEDASEFERLIAPKEVTDGTLSFPHPVPTGWGLERINRMTERLESGDHVEFAIVARETSTLIGGIGLDVNARHKRGHLGYWLGVDYWAKGYATEAASAVLDYGFQTLELHRIEAGHYPCNPASGRMLEKIGMQFEGVMRGDLLKGDQFEDTVMYARLRTDF